MKASTMTLSATIAALGLSLIVGTANAAPQAATKKTTVHLERMLFAIDISTGTLKHINGKQYTLTVPVKEIKSVLAFSDRPQRLALRLTPENYAQMIHSGPNSFDKNPPNAVVNIVQNGKQSMYPFTISGYTKGKNSFTYRLTALENHPYKPATGQISLFIDDGSGGQSCSSSQASNQQTGFGLIVQTTNCTSYTTF